MGDVADDYEEFEHIVDSMVADASHHGITIDRWAVLDKLGELVREGLVQPYVYRQDLRSFVETGDYSSDRVGDLWFYITAEGLRVFEPTGRE
ncbi:MAG: hypothetical protein KGM47_05680 [Acidobacteriota bacterium]|nr:hypothetical protein [Acidobacteriota bacterium]